MTTEVVRLDVPDLRLPNEILELAPSGSIQVQATSFVNRREPGWPIDWAALLRPCLSAALKHASSLMTNQRWLFFGSSSKPFNRLQARQWFFPLRDIEPDHFAKSSGGNCVYVLAEVRPSQLEKIADWCRSTQHGLILLTNCWPMSVDAAASLASIVFPQAVGPVDWKRTVPDLAMSRTILVRCYGAFDDWEASVDVFSHSVPVE